MKLAKVTNSPHPPFFCMNSRALAPSSETFGSYAYRVSDIVTRLDNVALPNKHA